MQLLTALVGRFQCPRFVARRDIRAYDQYRIEDKLSINCEMFAPSEKPVYLCGSLLGVLGRLTSWVAGESRTLVLGST